MAGSQKAITEIFDPYFARTAKAGHTAKAFETMLRGMLSTALGSLRESRDAFRRQVLETNPQLKGWRASTRC